MNSLWKLETKHGLSWFLNFLLLLLRRSLQSACFTAEAVHRLGMIPIPAQRVRGAIGEVVQAA
jgi:hypothetical protein